jgi:hypothetical protein
MPLADISGAHYNIFNSATFEALVLRKRAVFGEAVNG